jgi:hypothetical protein
MRGADTCSPLRRQRRMSVPVRLRDPTAWDGAPVTKRNGAAASHKLRALSTDDMDGSAAEGTVRSGLDGME